MVVPVAAVYEDNPTSRFVREVGRAWERPDVLAITMAGLRKRFSYKPFDFSISLSDARHSRRSFGVQLHRLTRRLWRGGFDPADGLPWPDAVGADP